jgi:hypothetical protein
VTNVIIVSFCCNNDQGTNSGGFSAIEFEDSVTGSRLSLNSLHLDERDQPAIEFMNQVGSVYAADERYEIERHSHESHVGNMAWDSVRMPHDSARKLCEDLLESNACQVDEFDTDHPFADIATRYA